MIVPDRRSTLDVPQFTLRQLADAVIACFLLAAIFVAAMAVPA